MSTVVEIALFLPFWRKRLKLVRRRNLAMGERIIDGHIDGRAWILASTGQRVWDNVSEMMCRRPEHLPSVSDIGDGVHKFKTRSPSSGLPDPDAAAELDQWAGHQEPKNP